MNNKKQKMKLSLKIILLAMVFSSTIEAQTFMHDSIAYEVISSTQPYTVMVTERMPKYAGDIEIPDTCTYQDIRYTVVKIGERAFNTCQELTSIKIPNTITAIEEWAFRMCTELTAVSIPNSVLVIEKEAFVDCWELTSIDIPTSLTTLEYRVFKDNFGLESVEIPNSVTEIKPGAFSSCSGLKSISLPNSITSLNGGFENCSGLTSIEIPNSVTFLGSALSGCSGLVEVILGSSLDTIWHAAFDFCSSLEKIYCSAKVPPYVHGEAFETVTPSSISLYVPEESIESYKVAAEWEKFNIISFTSLNDSETNGISFYPNPVVDVLEINGLKSQTSISVYNASGLKVQTLIATNKTERISFRDLPMGLYIVILESDTEIWIEKVFRN